MCHSSLVGITQRTNSVMRGKTKKLPFFLAVLPSISIIQSQSCPDYQNLKPDLEEKNLPNWIKNLPFKDAFVTNQILNFNGGMIKISDQLYNNKTISAKQKLIELYRNLTGDKTGKQAVSVNNDENVVSDKLWDHVRNIYFMNGDLHVTVHNDMINKLMTDPDNAQPSKTRYEKSEEFCQGIGGTMYVPHSAEEFYQGVSDLCNGGSDSKERFWVNLRQKSVNMNYPDGTKGYVYETADPYFADEFDVGEKCGVQNSDSSLVDFYPYTEFKIPNQRNSSSCPPSDEYGNYDYLLDKDGCTTKAPTCWADNQLPSRFQNFKLNHIDQNNMENYQCVTMQCDGVNTNNINIKSKWENFECDANNVVPICRISDWICGDFWDCKEHQDKFCGDLTLQSYGFHFNDNVLDIYDEIDEYTEIDLKQTVGNFYDHHQNYFVAKSSFDQSLSQNLNNNLISFNSTKNHAECPCTCPDIKDDSNLEEDESSKYGDAIRNFVCENPSAELDQNWWNDKISTVCQEKLQFGDDGSVVGHLAENVYVPDVVQADEEENLVLKSENNANGTRISVHRNFCGYCENPPILENGYCLPYDHTVNLTSNGPFYFQTNDFYCRCDEGFSLIDSTYPCPNKQWADPICSGVEIDNYSFDTSHLNCVPTICVNLPDLMNAQTENSNTFADQGEDFEFDCRHDFQGEAVVSCGDFTVDSVHGYFDQMLMNSCTETIDPCDDQDLIKDYLENTQYPGAFNGIANPSDSNEFIFECFEDFQALPRKNWWNQTANYQRDLAIANGLVQPATDRSPYPTTVDEVMFGQHQTLIGGPALRTTCINGVFTIPSHECVCDQEIAAEQDKIQFLSQTPRYLMCEAVINSKEPESFQPISSPRVIIWNGVVIPIAFAYFF